MPSMVRHGRAPRWPHEAKQVVRAVPNQTANNEYNRKRHLLGILAVSAVSTDSSEGSAKLKTTTQNGATARLGRCSADRLPV